jgi:hypothetical protein
LKLSGHLKPAHLVVTLIKPDTFDHPPERGVGGRCSPIGGGCGHAISFGMAKKRATKGRLPDKAAPTYPAPRKLLADLRSLIQTARSGVAQVVNSAQVLLYWQIGHRLQVDFCASGLLCLPGKRPSGCWPRVTMIIREASARPGQQGARGGHPAMPRSRPTMAQFATYLSDMVDPGHVRSSMGGMWSGARGTAEMPSRSFSEF